MPATASNASPPQRRSFGMSRHGSATVAPASMAVSESVTHSPSPDSAGRGSVVKIEATIVASATRPMVRSAIGIPTHHTVRRVPPAVIGVRVDPPPPVGGGAGSTPAPMTDAGAMPMLSAMTSTLVHTETAIEVSGVRRAYGPVQALDGVDLTVRRGELLALLGPNGAGKTTLVEILEGHRVADSGRVDVLGHDPARRQRAFLERIGIVLQEEGLDPNLNVGEAVALYSAAY